MNKTFAFLLLAISACAVDTEDGPDDDFLTADDKADTSGISADDADGVLHVANDLSYMELRSAGVTSTAARNIVAYRVGDDGKAGTADDERFETLRELDAVPYVGPVAFTKLLAYAKAHGYVPFDHFALPACTPISYADAISRFPAGQSSWHTGKMFSLATRSRDCNLYTGCGAWQPSNVQLMQIAGGHGLLGGALHALPPTGPVDVQVQAGGSIHMLMSAAEPGHSTTQIAWDCMSLDPGKAADQLSCVVKIQFAPYDTIYGYLPKMFGGEPVVDSGNEIDMKGMICSDGRFGFVSKLAANIPNVPSDSENNKNQIAIWGAL